MKVLEGIRGLSWQSGELNTFVAALRSALEYLGENHTYSYLMGLSGAAFRLQIHRDGLCPSGPDATCGFNSGHHLLDMLRWSFRCLMASDGEKKTKEAVHASIDRKIPVLAIDLIGAPDWGLIVGYDEDGEFLVLTYHNRNKDQPQRAEKPPWSFYLLDQKLGHTHQDRSEEMSLFLLKNLVENSSYGPYHAGWHALQAWKELLEHIGRFLAGSGDKRIEHLLGNYWNYVSLIDCRRAAKIYLREEIRYRRFENNAIYGKLGALFGQEADVLDRYHIMPPFHDQGKSMLEEVNLKRQIEALESALSLEQKVSSLWDKLNM